MNSDNKALSAIDVLERELKVLQGKCEYIKDQLNWNADEKNNLQESLFKKQEEIVELRNAITKLRG